MIKKAFLTALVVSGVIFMFSLSAFACTTISVGKKATVDGSTLTSYNCDCGGCNWHNRIVPAKDWEEGALRSIGEEYGTIPQVAHTYQTLGGYVMNEKGVSLGETTCPIDTSTEYGKKVKEVMFSSKGLINYEYIMDVVVERVATAREGVELLGKLVETYKWAPIEAECFNFADGNEVWIMEVYGHDLWCAFRLADDEVFVSANACRIRDIDLNDTENVLHSPNIVSFAVEQGWYDPDSGKPFRPADVYAPKSTVYNTRRVWRAYDLMAPSLKLSPHETEYPLTVKPDAKLSVDDIFKIVGDHYEGTEYDLTKGPAAGPWGNPLRYANKGNGDWERSIGLHRTFLYFIAQIRGDLPDPIKGVAWFGYCDPGSSYITPLSGSMKDVPSCYTTGSKREPFDPDGGWWACAFVQQMAELRYNQAIQDIREFRDPKLAMLYQTVPLVQDKAAAMYGSDPEGALDLLHNFYYQQALALHAGWKDLGRQLLGKYALGYVNFKTAEYPEEWNKLIGYGPLER
ncbi:MAG TPA: C69 family dipeptidase [Synergistaceae bacterium]|nr:C69 family dipeptidase [Synergistaceae bacterium]